MLPAEFKSKWQKFSGKESSAYQEHFNDLCRLLRFPTPAQADPTGTETFCFQKYVVKDAELSLFDASDDPDAPSPAERRGFADVWKSGCFAWEYKGKGKDLEAAYKQLLRYRENLLNPPLLVVCDFERYIVRTNFTGTVQEKHEFTNAEVDTPRVQRVLRALFQDPDALKPQRTTAQVTERLATQLALVAKSLQGRASRELTDARTRAELNFAQKKNLRIARFLNRLVFCFFAQNTELLPKNLFSEVARTGLDDPRDFAATLETLFRVMATGGKFGAKTIRQFNGHLFHDATVFELTSEELRTLAEASEADWQFIEPSILGTLFERALEPEQRSQLGAHYTSEADIKTLVEPVLMAPLRREWSVLKGELAAVFVKGKATPAQRARLTAFQDKLAAVTVLDPACGSGNFLYIALQQLLGLEKEVITFAAPLGLKLKPQVSVQQLRAIEINPYAFELAQVSVQIGYLQWRRENGFDNDRTPILQNLDGFQNKDALVRDVFKTVPQDLKEAQIEEHLTVVPFGSSQVEIGGISDQGELSEAMGASPKPGVERVKVYYERVWPSCDVIVGNPPFLGDKLMRGQLGDHYVEALRRIYGDRIPGQSDLCCYWFEKARNQIENGECKRAGLIATQGIRGGANREVLKRIKNTGDIFFAESDREWILAGATVHVSMIGLDAGGEVTKQLDGQTVADIAPNLSGGDDTTVAVQLAQNKGIGFVGVAQKAPFDVAEDIVQKVLLGTNPHGRPNSDVLTPIRNAEDLTRRSRNVWNVDFGLDRSLEDSARYELPFEYIKRIVYPLRINHREARQTRYWWLFARPGPDMREALHGLPRFLATPRVSKHRLFVWLSPEILCDSAAVAFARSDDYSFGILHSRSHEVWALRQGTQLREKESGFRYTPTTCFETFPFPRPTPEQEAAIAAAARDLNTLRERWLNPPEWTQTRTLTFPGTAAGPWARYVDPATVEPATGVGTVRYPRLEPRDDATAALLKKRTLTNLYNERPAWLDLAHRKLDATVAAAYGWPADLSDDQILERLLALNLQRASEEAARPVPSKSKASRSKADDELL